MFKFHHEVFVIVHGSEDGEAPSGLGPVTAFEYFGDVC